MGDDEMDTDRDAPGGENDQPDARLEQERDETRRSLLNKISRFGVYMPPALIATLTVAAPIPSGSS